MITPYNNEIYVSMRLLLYILEAGTVYCTPAVCVMQSALSGQDQVRCLTYPFSLCTVSSLRSVLAVIPVHTAHSNLAAT